MVFKYTYDERHKLAEIEEDYARRLAKIEKDIKNLDADSEEYKALVTEHIKLYDEQYQKLGDLEAQIEQQHFDQLGNDPDVILANGKEQTALILKVNYEDRILYDIDEEGNPKSLDPRFESKTAISMLKHGLRLHFSALKGNPQQHKELRDYIYNYVAASPYTYTNIKGEKAEAAAEAPEDEDIDNLLNSNFLPMFNNNSINNFAKITKRDFKEDEFTDEATALTSSGEKYIVKNYKNLIGDLSTSTNKILFTAISFLTRNNFTPKKTQGRMTNPTVEIPLTDYAEANNKSADKNFKKQVRNDLHDLKEVEFSWEKVRGKNKGDFFVGQIISSYGIMTANGKSYIRINFDIDAARSLVKYPVTQFPPALLGHDNRNKNGFPVGYAIAVHNANYNNIVKGTNETLAVKSLLADAPDITTTYEELKAKGRRDWKTQIKEKLEAALDSNIEVGYLESWTYVNPKTQRSYTPEEADNLTWDEYYSLCVDYRILHDNIQLEDYVRRKSAEKKALAEKKAEAKNANEKSEKG